MNKDLHHICLCADNNYICHCAVTILSVKKTNPDLNICFHLIIGQTISDENRIRIKEFSSICDINLFIHQLDESLLDGVKFRDNRPLSKAAYYRLLLGSVLPKDIHQVLYLDSDILVLKDISCIFKLDLNGYALAATRDISNMEEDHRIQLGLQYFQPYFCSGMMMVNLDYWRENSVEEKLISFAKKERTVYYHDQDVLNWAFKHNWFRLSPEWNYFFPVIYQPDRFENINEMLSLRNNAKIVHFFHYFKPWYNFRIKGEEWNQYRRLYDEYLDNTPWKNAQKNNSHVDDRLCYRMYDEYKWKKRYLKIKAYTNFETLFYLWSKIF